MSESAIVNVTSGVFANNPPRELNLLNFQVVGVLNSTIFNSFHNWVEFGTILEGLRNFGVGGIWTLQPPPLGTPRSVLNFIVNSHFGEGVGKHSCDGWRLAREGIAQRSFVPQAAQYGGVLLASKGKYSAEKRLVTFLC